LITDKFPWFSVYSHNLISNYKRVNYREPSPDHNKHNRKKSVLAWHDKEIYTIKPSGDVDEMPRQAYWYELWVMKQREVREGKEFWEARVYSMVLYLERI
jgi:hypothetical protein